MVSISRLPVLAATRSSWPKAELCTESDKVNVSSDVNPTTNVQENNNDRDDQENGNISCPENQVINEDNSSNVHKFRLGTE